MEHINKLLNEFKIFKDEENDHDSKLNPFLDSEDEMEDDGCECTCGLDDHESEYDDYEEDPDALRMEDDEQQCCDDTEDDNHEDESTKVDDVKGFMAHMAAFFSKKEPESNQEMEEDTDDLEMNDKKDSFLGPDVFNKELNSNKTRNHFDKAFNFNSNVIDHDEEDHPLADVMDRKCDNEEEEEDKFQGIIRTVKGANLVYKRQNPDGDYTELWIYNIGKDIKHSNDVKRAIVAGTDIDPSRMESEDGTQKMDLYSVGNVQYLELSGLPN